MRQNLIFLRVLLTIFLTTLLVFPLYSQVNTMSTGSSIFHQSSLSGINFDKVISSNITKPLSGESDIVLIAPENGAGMRMLRDSKYPLDEIMFKWLPVAKKEKYSLKIVEILDKQSPESAMKENSAYYENKNIKTNYFQYPKQGKKFEDGKRYAWQIRGEKSYSMVWMFGNPKHVDSATTINGCCGDPGTLPDWLNYIGNCSFESVGSTYDICSDGYAQFWTVFGWSTGCGAVVPPGPFSNSPDLYRPPYYNACIGTVPPCDGTNYVGLSMGKLAGYDYTTESINGYIRNYGLSSSHTYTVSAKLRLGTVRTSPAAVGFWLHRHYYMSTQEEWQLIGWTNVTDNTQWQTFEATIKPNPVFDNADWQALVIKGYQGCPSDALSYVFIDCVKIAP